MSKRIKFRKVIRDLDLDEYYDTGEIEIIRVWVNPPRSIRNEYNEITESSRELLEALSKADPENKSALKEIGRRMKENADRYLEIWALLWSQDKNETTHWSPDEVAQLQKDCEDHDPGLWQFITTLTIGMIVDYINASQKKGMRR